MVTRTEALIEALRAEREHYVRQAREDRVTAVDAELVKLGVAPPQKPAVPRKRAQREG